MNIVADVKTQSEDRFQEGADPTPVVIEGGGPVGPRAAHELSPRGRNVVLFNALRLRPY